jgi:hypothetical protein
MSQFTQLNLQSKSDSKSQNATNSEFIGKQTIALFAGAVLATTLIGGLLLETSGCSRENDTAVSSAIQRPITPASSPAPMQETPAAQTPAPVARKVVKKQPTAVLYADKNYGVTFRYPKRYTVKSADPTKPDTTQQSAMNFVEPGGVNVVTVELPKNSYRGTDFFSASFNVSVNPTLSAEQCSQFALLHPDSAGHAYILPAKLKLAGMDLAAIEAISGPETSQSDSKYYHAFVNGACYEFALGLSTQAQAKDAEPHDNEDPAPAVDRTIVFRRLQNILATVKIESVAAPEVTATAPAAPATPAVPTTPAPAAANQ